MLFPAGLGAAEIVVETPGTLFELVGDEKETMESLKVSGPINGDDIAFLREMMGTDMGGMFGGLEMKEDGKWWYTPIGCSLASLDLSEAQIVAGDAEYYSGKVTENDVVGDNMFEMCLNAKTILLPETSSVVGNFAFGSSMYLESMVIPDGVQSVGKSAFISCYSLKQVTFGAGVTSIGSDVFYQCSALESITFKSETVPEIGNNAFADVPETCVIYVPTEAAKAAFAADPAFAGFTIEAESQGEVEIPSEIVMEAPGTLSSVIGGNKDLIERLKIIGPVDGADISFLREMMGTENWTLNPAPDENGWWWYVPQNGSLAYLDLSEAQIVAGDAEYYSGKVTENDVVGDKVKVDLTVEALPEGRTIRTAQLNISAPACSESVTVRQTVDASVDGIDKDDDVLFRRSGDKWMFEIDGFGYRYVRIYDSIGRLVVEDSVYGTECIVDASVLQNGIYLVQFSGDKSVTLKVSK